MMKDGGKLVWYLFPICLVYYLVPIIMLRTPLDDLIIKGFIINLLLVYQPVLILLISAIYSAKHGFSWWFPLVLGLLYLPVDSMFFPHAEGAEVYVLPYMVVGFLGSNIGILVRNWKRSGNSKKNT
ncbi:TPA: hypothetical protein ACF9FI_001509 [Streptococcus suis]